MRLFLALLLLAIGCGSDHAIWGVPNEGQAARLVGAALNVNLPLATWVCTVCPGYSQTAVVVNGVCYDGYSSRNGMIIAWRGTIGESAYAHEAAHYSRFVTGQDGDVDHKDVALWSLARELAIRLQRDGI